MKPTDESKKPQGLKFPGKAQEKPSGPRTLGLSAKPTKAPERASVASLGLSSEPIKTKPVVRSLTDELIDKAVAIDPTVEGFIIRARIDFLLKATNKQIIEYGQANTVELQNASRSQATIAATISRLNAMEWITKTAEASCKIPSMLDRFVAKTPEFYQEKLSGIKPALIRASEKLLELIKAVEPDLNDLKNDIIALQVVLPELDDDTLSQVADRKLRSLHQALTTLMNLVQTLRNSYDMACEHSSRIDDLLTITIPNWIMANQR